MRSVSDHRRHPVRKIASVAARYEDAPIYHYGSYEPKSFLRVTKRHRIESNSFANNVQNSFERTLRTQVSLD